MKKLFIVRHAKSSMASYGQADFDRPLNERGKTDAILMAKRLKEKTAEPVFFVSSPARRARKTAKAFCQNFGLQKESLQLEDSLYNAPAIAYQKVLETLDNSIQSVAIFGHNPGITDFVNTLVDHAKVDTMPTCAIFAVRFELNDWKDFVHAEKHFLFFDFPKKEV